MKSTWWALSLLLLSVPASGVELEGESSFYLVNLKGNYQRQLGYEEWRGRKRGALYRLTLSQEFRVKKGSTFRVSVTTGNPKSPRVNALTPDGDELFEGGIRSFSVRELYLKKEHFLFDGLTLTAGKQRFRIGVVLDDYLWGGKFDYRLGEEARVVWQQIAGYEGRHLLFGTKAEDDLDLFSLSVEKKGVEAGIYRIMDARGEEPGIAKSGLFGGVRWKGLEVEGATQNGRVAGTGSLEFNGVRVIAGFAQKGFTSYGFREGVRDLGVIFRPAFSDLKFLRVEGEGEVYGLRVKAYGAYAERVNGERIGGEAGGEVTKEVSEGWEVFLKGALGSEGSYALFGGLRWGVKPLKLKEVRGWNLKVDNYFGVVGEYSDLPRRFYYPQLGYEGWERARHAGFWHSTYRLGIEGERFRVQVATGRSSKVDYLIWGNTADCFKYQREKGKEWHLEEAYLKVGRGKAGKFGLELPGLFNDYLTGGGFSWRRIEVYGVGTGDVEEDEGVERAFFGIVKVKGRWGEVFGGVRRGEEGEGFAGARVKWKWFEGGAVREFLKGRDGWGGYLKAGGKVREVELRGVYGVYSEEFTSFNLREYFRDLGYAVRPTVKDLRFLKGSLKKEFRSGIKKVDRLKPAVEVVYDRFTRFSGGFVAEEGGVVIHLKPGKRCELSLAGVVGSSGSYYEGILFKVRW